MKYRQKIIVIAWLVGFFLGGMVFAAEVSSAVPSDINLHREAKEAIYNKEWDHAVQLLQKLDSQYPGSVLRVEALYWLAYSLEKQNKKNEALQLLNRLIETYKDNEWADDAKMLRVRISADLCRQGFPQYRRYIMAAVQQESNEDIDLKMMALDILIRLDRPAALAILEKFYKKNPDPEIRDNIIFILRRCGENQLIARLSALNQKKGIVTLKEMKNAYGYISKPIIVPQLIHRVDPVYPREALEEGVTGDVTLIATLDKKGYVQYVVATKGAHPLLAEAAEKAVKQWKFFPYTRKGSRVSAACIIVLNFDLEKN
jgi:TonB family protein